MNSFNAIIGGCSVVILGLLILSSNQDLLTGSMLILAGILSIIFGVHGYKGYNNKTYYLTSFSIIGLMALILIYISLFMSLNAHFYTIVGGFLLLLIIYVYSYHHRCKNVLRPWKNEW